MGNVSHLCFSLLAMVTPTCFRTASLDDTPGEQMCSNEFILNSDVRERDFFFLFLCHSAQYAFIRSRARHSRPRNKPFLWQRDKTQVFITVETKIAFFGGAHSFFFNDTVILIIIHVCFSFVFTHQQCVIGA